MGNCAAQCCSDGTDGKQKVTVEQKDGDYSNQNVAYINEQRQEFEIEYGTAGGP